MAHQKDTQKYVVALRWTFYVLVMVQHEKNQNKNSSLHGVNEQQNNACENCLRETRNYGDVYVECKVYNYLCSFCLLPTHCFFHGGSFEMSALHTALGWPESKYAKYNYKYKDQIEFHAKIPPYRCAMLFSDHSLGRWFAFAFTHLYIYKCACTRTKNFRTKFGFVCLNRGKNAIIIRSNWTEVFFPARMLNKNNNNNTATVCCNRVA